MPEVEEEPIQTKRSYRQENRKSRTVSNDSIEEYIGEFKDVSKPG